MMKMYLYFGIPESEILFSFWTVTTVGGLIGSMVGIFVIALLYEGLKGLREYMLQKTFIETRDRTGSGSNQTTKGFFSVSAKPSPFTCQHVFQTLLHMIQLTISYLLMLIFMTYNAWLCIAVILGAGVGYFIFGWRVRSVLADTEHCRD